MESLERLRKYVKERDRYSISHSHVQAINEIADAIEEEFKEQEQAHNFAYGQVYEFADSLSRQLLDFDKMEECPVEMAEHGWVKLPVDADGVPIRVGDLMDTEHFGTVEVEGFVHNAVAFYNYSGQPAYLCTSPANLCRHHHEPTVEGVLREFAHVGIHIGAKDGLVAGEFDFYADEDSIAKYAAKLRLAGDE